MIRTLARTVLAIVIVVAIAAFVIGYRWAGGRGVAEPDLSVGTTGEAGAAIGEKGGEAANQAQQIASNATLTARIKSRMTLDDTIDAREINVDTSNGVVTLHGGVRSAAEHQRALQLTRETEGVRSVVDLLSVR